MKFNRKIQFRTLTIILVLTFILMNFTASANNPNQINSKRAQNEEEINTSAPITPQYKYHYENDFDYYDFIFDSVAYIEVLDWASEWSQDPNDGIDLQLYYFNAIQGFGTQFSISGSLFVESHNIFEIQNNRNLGGYVDWYIDIDITPQTFIDYHSVDIILTIFRFADPPINELINIYNLDSQEGRFYLPNFDQYIWPDGKIRFALTGTVSGIVLAAEVLSLLLSFEGLRVIQEIMPKVQVAEKRTLILAHGYSLLQTPETPAKWAKFILAQEFLEAYDDIIVLNYADTFYAFRYSKDDNGIWHDYVIIDMNRTITNFHSITYIASVLALYILQDSEYIEDNVDFICHSMGGLVTRYMIKHFYTGLQYIYASVNRTFKIKNVAMIATPNHGSYVNARTDTQQLEMVAGSDFLNDLNNNSDCPNPNSEIPLSGLDINWFTYRSGLYVESASLRHDGIVDIYSVPLIGANNKGMYQLDHEIMRQNEMMKTVIFNDIVKPPAIIEAIFNGGTPGIIIGVEDLTLQPNYEESGGKTILSITIPAEDQVDINPSTFTLHISSDTYQMTLNAGSYEVELPLADGDYSFLITAELTGQDGRLYQMSGNLRIIDDDAKPPEIELTPGDISISDVDAIGGLSVYWEISDYSGISEATVKINDVEIRSYTDQGTITDSYLLPNEPGTYTISVWARDNDSDPNHDPPGGDWLEDSIESTITIYDDDNTPPNIESTPGGDLRISKEDAAGGVLVSWEISDESGISEANVEINGIEIRSYNNFANISDSYLIPNEIGIYTLSIWAKDNDNDSENDWLEYSTMITITIYEEKPPPPKISGYNIFVLFAILSIVIFIIYKKGRRFKF